MSTAINLPVKLEDGSEILADYSSESTRYVLYRHGQTGNINLLINQNGNTVSVRTCNLRMIITKHVPWE